MAAAGSAKGNASGIRMGKAFVEIGAVNNVPKVLKDIEKQFKKFGTTLGKIGLGAAGLGGALLAPLVGMANHFIEAGSAATDMAERLGTTTETVTALGYAASLAGGGLEDVETNLGKMQKTIAEGAANGDDFLGGLLGQDIDSQLAEIADLIAGIEDPTLRSAKAMEFFGKSGRKMLPFLKDGAAGLERLRAQAAEDGAIIGKEEADRADRIGDAMTRVLTVIKSVGRSIGGAFLPASEDAERFAEKVSFVGSMLRRFIDRNAELVKTLGMVAAGILAVGTALVGAGAVVLAIGAAFGGLATAVAGVATVLSFILSPLGLIVVGVGMLTAGLAIAASETETFQGAMTGLGEFDDRPDLIISDYQLSDGESGIAAIASLRRQLRSNVPAFLISDLSLAIEIAWTGAKVAFRKGINELKKIWIDLRTWFVGMWEQAINLIATSILSIIEAIPESVRKAAGLTGLNSIDEIRRGQKADLDLMDLNAKRAKKALDGSDVGQSELDRLARLAALPLYKRGADEGAMGQVLAAAAGMGGSVKGMFGGSGLNASLAFGDSRGIEGNTRRTADGVEDIARLMEKAGPLVWGA